MIAKIMINGYKLLDASEYHNHNSRNYLKTNYLKSCQAAYIFQKYSNFVSSHDILSSLVYSN